MSGPVLRTLNSHSLTSRTRTELEPDKTMAPRGSVAPLWPGFRNRRCRTPAERILTGRHHCGPIRRHPGNLANSVHPMPFKFGEPFLREAGNPYEEQQARRREMREPVASETAYRFAVCYKSLRRVTRLYRRSRAASVPRSDRRTVETTRS